MPRAPSSVAATVKHGSLTFRILATSTGFLLNWQDPDTGARKQKRSTTLQPLKEFAKAIGSHILSPDRHAAAVVTRDEMAEFRAWKAAQAQHTLTLAAARDAFLAATAQRKGRSHVNLRGLTYDTEAFMGHAGRDTLLVTVTRDHIDAFIASRSDKSARRRDNLRASLITFFRWNRKARNLPDKPTAAEESTPITVIRSEIGILTAADMAKMLTHAAAGPRQMLPWLLFCGFAGIRTDELYPERNSTKLPLQWDNVRLDDCRPEHPNGLIFVSAATAKQTHKSQGRPRYIPISANLREWLEWLGPISTSGDIRHMTVRPSEAQWTLKMAALLEKPWPKNALRHSFGTYRAAILGEMGKTAREMGNSESECQRSYDRVANPMEAETWFSLTPKSLKIPTIEKMEGE